MDSYCVTRPHSVSVVYLGKSETMWARGAPDLHFRRRGKPLSHAASSLMGLSCQACFPRYPTGAVVPPGAVLVWPFHTL